ncbi:MAG: YceH family protein [Armatimonadota bacterium]|nr:YceH family protein [bacterium]
MIVLNDVEMRVLGSLVEKEITTPEYYPLTLNSLTTACNQKSNRDPVVSYDETRVAEAVDSLREKNLVITVRGRDSRVPKYDNYFAEKLDLKPVEVAVMCELMLRGPQTVGELRTRGERLYQFSGLDEVDETLNGLMNRDEEPLVVKLPRQPGQKECRYAHLLAGEQGVESAINASAEAVDCETSARIDLLEQEIQSLRAELTELKAGFLEFRKQFE